MDDPSIYGNTSDDGRYIFNKPSKERDEPMEENEGNDNGKRTKRLDRCRRRAERKSNCSCKPRSRGRRKRKIRSQNPFIIFYLEMYYKSPGKRVTEVAREAGKIWCGMSDEDRKRYIRLAEKERRRRCRMRRRRRGAC